MWKHIASVFSVATSPLKRIYKYVFKRLLGGYLKNELDFDQLDVQLAAGAVQLKDLELDTSVLNEALKGLPIRIAEGYIGSVKLTIPWKGILKESSIVEVQDIDLVIVPADNYSEVIQSFMQKSEFIAQKHHLDIPSDDPYEEENIDISPSDLRPQDDSEGLQMLTDLIDKIMAKIQVRVDSISVRFQQFPDCSQPSSGSSILLHLPSLQLQDETPPNAAPGCNVKSAKIRGLTVHMLDSMDDLLASSAYGRVVTSALLPLHDPRTIAKGESEQDDWIRIKTVSTKIDSSQPRTTVDCFFRSIQMMLSVSQLSALYEVAMAFASSGSGSVSANEPLNQPAESIQSAMHDEVPDADVAETEKAASQFKLNLLSFELTLQTELKGKGLHRHWRTHETDLTLSTFNVYATNHSTAFPKLNCNHIRLFAGHFELLQLSQPQRGRMTVEVTLRTLDIYEHSFCRNGQVESFLEEPVNEFRVDSHAYEQQNQSRSQSGTSVYMDAIAQSSLLGSSQEEEEEADDDEEEDYPLAESYTIEDTSNVEPLFEEDEEYSTLHLIRFVNKQSVHRNAPAHVVVMVELDDLSSESVAPKAFELPSSDVEFSGLSEDDSLVGTVLTSSRKTTVTLQAVVFDLDVSFLLRFMSYVNLLTLGDSTTDSTARIDRVKPVWSTQVPPTPPKKSLTTTDIISDIDKMESDLSKHHKVIQDQIVIMAPSVRLALSVPLHNGSVSDHEDEVGGEQGQEQEQEQDWVDSKLSSCLVLELLSVTASQTVVSFSDSQSSTVIKRFLSPHSAPFSYSTPCVGKWLVNIESVSLAQITADLVGRIDTLPLKPFLTVRSARNVRPAIQIDLRSESSLALRRAASNPSTEGKDSPVKDSFNVPRWEEPDNELDDLKAKQRVAEQVALELAAKEQADTRWRDYAGDLSSLVVGIHLPVSRIVTTKEEFDSLYLLAMRLVASFSPAAATTVADVDISPNYHRSSPPSFHNSDLSPRDTDTVRSSVTSSSEVSVSVRLPSQVEKLKAILMQSVILKLDQVDWVIINKKQDSDQALDSADLDISPSSYRFHLQKATLFVTTGYSNAYTTRLYFATRDAILFESYNRNGDGRMESSASAASESVILYSWVAPSQDSSTGNTVTVSVTIQAQPHSNAGGSVDTTVDVAVRGIVLSYNVQSKWMNDFPAFFKLPTQSDSSLTGSPSVQHGSDPSRTDMTKIHLSVRNFALDYLPLSPLLHSRALFTVETFQLSSTRVFGSPTEALSISIRDGSLHLLDVPAAALSSQPNLTGMLGDPSMVVQRTSPTLGPVDKRASRSRSSSMTAGGSSTSPSPSPSPSPSRCRKIAEKIQCVSLQDYVEAEGFVHLSTVDFFECCVVTNLTHVKIEGVTGLTGEEVNRRRIPIEVECTVNVLHFYTCKDSFLTLVNVIDDLVVGLADQHAKNKPVTEGALYPNQLLPSRHTNVLAGLDENAFSAKRKKSKPDKANIKSNRFSSSPGVQKSHHGDLPSNSMERAERYMSRGKEAALTSSLFGLNAHPMSESFIANEKEKRQVNRPRAVAGGSNNNTSNSSSHSESQSHSQSTRAGSLARPSMDKFFIDDFYAKEESAGNETTAVFWTGHSRGVRTGEQAVSFADRQEGEWTVLDTGLESSSIPIRKRGHSLPSKPEMKSQMRGMFGSDSEGEGTDSENDSDQEYSHPSRRPHLFTDHPSSMFGDSIDESVTPRSAGGLLSPTASEQQAQWLEGHDGAQIIHNHVVLPDNYSTERRASLPPDFPFSVTRVVFKCNTFCWRLFGGTDWGDAAEAIPSTGKTPLFETPSETTVKSGTVPLSSLAGKSLSKKQPSLSSSSALGGGKKKAQVQRGKRQTDMVLEVRLLHTFLQHDTFSRSDQYSSRLALRVKDVEVLDCISTSAIRKFLSFLKTEQAPRIAGSDMFTLELDSVRPDLKVLEMEEYRIKVAILPLRFNVDQDTLEFLIEYFVGRDIFVAQVKAARSSPKGKKKDPEDVTTDTPTVGRSRSSSVMQEEEVTDLEDETATFEPNSFGFDTAVAQVLDVTAAAATGSSAAPRVFIQMFEAKAFQVSIDYKPKRLDITGLKDGNYAELINILSLDGLSLTLKKVKLTGIDGWSALLEGMVSSWMLDITRRQLLNCVSGVAPIRSLVNVGSGVADLLIMPVKQYKRDGRVFRGIKRGVSSFLKNVAVETINITEKVVSGTQAILEHADDIIANPMPSARDPQQLRRAQASARGGSMGNLSGGGKRGSLVEYTPTGRAGHSRNMEQPRDTKEGIQQALESLTRGFKTAANTIVSMPMEEYSRSGTGGYVKSVIRAVPVAILRPVIGATEALSRTLKGVRNQVDPRNIREFDEKFKSRR